MAVLLQLRSQFTLVAFVSAGGAVRSGGRFHASDMAHVRHI